RRYQHAGAADETRSFGPTHGCVHQRYCVNRAGPEDCAVLYWTPACGRESGRCFEAACGRTSEPDSDALTHASVCDALSRNLPKRPDGVEILLVNCLAHGRRQFVEVAGSFPAECR